MYAMPSRTDGKYPAESGTNNNTGNNGRSVTEEYEHNELVIYYKELIPNTTHYAILGFSMAEPPVPIAPDNTKKLHRIHGYFRFKIVK